MEIIRHWIISLCGATALTGLFHVFLSKSSAQKAINIFLSIFVLFYTIIPLTDIEYSNQFEIENVDMNIDELSKDCYEQIIFSSINKICSENSVELLSIDIDSNLQDEILNVNKIIVEIDNSERAKEIETQIYEELGFEVIVIG